MSTDDHAQIVEWFPGLSAAQSFEITSPSTDEYNCIAWAADDTENWWWPIYHYWPDGVPRERTVDAFIAAYATLGYSRCANGAFEQGFEKIVIYCSADGKPTHAARQLDDGRWTSKLGEFHDIAHQSFLDIEGEHYGAAAVFLYRPSA